MVEREAQDILISRKTKAKKKNRRNEQIPVAKS